MSNINIELAWLEDYHVCKRISNQFNESTPTQEVFKELVSNKQIFVAIKNDTITWFCTYKRLWNDSFFLQFLRVDKDFHKQWIASKLIGHIENLWKNRKVYEIFSTVTQDNVPSINLHKKMWYKEVWSINFDSGKETVFLKVL